VEKIIINPTHHPLDNSLPGMFRSSQRLRGIFNGIPSPALVEMCAFAGFDFVVIDNVLISASKIYEKTSKNL